MAFVFRYQLLGIGHIYIEYALLHEPLNGKLVRLYVPSKSLRRVNKMFVYLPPGYDESSSRYPVVYLLHGQPGEARDWFYDGRAHETAEKMIFNHKIKPLILVSADCYGPRGSNDRTDFLNAKDGHIMVEDYMARELPNFMDGRYRTIPSPNARALVGLSSGGYGATNIGLKHRDTFGVIVSHSGFFEPRFERKAIRRMLGPTGSLWDENSPMRQVKKHRSDELLHIFMDVGRSDDLLDDNDMFAKELAHYEIPHNYTVVNGSHSWSLWRSRFRVSLPYVAGRFETLSKH